MNFIRENIVKIVTFIVILVVMIIVFSFVFKGTGSSKSNTYSQMEENLKVVAEKYANKNVKLLPKDEKEQSKINTDTLINAKYIKELHSIEDENVKCSGHVLINKNGDNYKYIPYIKCGKYYETKTIANYIETNETVVTSDDGLYKNGERYAYKGENPNNYLKIDEGIYRILEISDDELRVISTIAYKDRSVWDNRYNIEIDNYKGINDFSKSRLRDNLDSAYNSDFFSDIERSFFISHDICIGKRSLDDESIDGNAECSKIFQNQKISMIYVSDYMRASTDPNCTNSSSESCSNYNYLEGISSSLETITAVADNTYQVYRIDSGMAGIIDALKGFKIYPVVYIDKNALYAGGNGTEENPYTIR